MQYLSELGEQPTGMPFTAYYDLNMQNLDLEIGFPVARRLTARGEIQPSEFPGGPLASVWHIGPYDQIGSAYDALTEWIKERGYQGAGPVYEIYYSEPETPPEQIRTRVVIPVKPA
jgi:effector-binding domain-containing protein